MFTVILYFVSFDITAISEMSIIYPTTTKVLLRPEHISKCLEKNNVFLNNACILDLLCIHLREISSIKAHQVLSKCKFAMVCTVLTKIL